jgi:alkylmercury lyase
MEKPDPEIIAQQLTDSLKGSLTGDFIEIIKLLMKGKPLTYEEVAKALSISEKDIPDALNKMNNIELDDNGNVIGAGITLNPTRHNFYIKGKHLYTWCAFDTLFFPIILNETAEVESKCPVSDVNIKLTVTPKKIEPLEPAEAAISIVVPEASDACRNLRSAFCNKTFFFKSEGAAKEWVKGSDIIILSVYDAYQLGQKFTKNLLSSH